MPNRHSFNLSGLNEFMKIGGPSIVMTCLEWWSFELMTVIASYISIQSVAVQIIIINNSHVFFMPHFGLCISATILTGKYIGAQDIPMAKLYHRTLQIMGAIQSLILGSIIFLFRRQIAEFYTSLTDL
jgi:MATE family multidrug resistance protein